MEGPRDWQDRSRWLLAPAAMLAVAVFFYPLLLGTPLIDPDEGLLAAIAQEMVERGDWVTPRLLGEPFLDKPILFVWARAASIKLFGASEAAVRFPGLMFGLLGVMATGAVGWRMFGRRTGLLAGMFYATMVLPTALAQAAMGDVALVPWVGLAVLLFWEADRAPTAKTAAWLTLAIGLVLGLACLTKGLTGVALVGVAYGSYLLVTRRLSVAACIRGAVALAIAALVAAPWYVAMELHNPGYLHYYFVERHLMGFATNTQHHGHEPWWYYLPVLAGGGLPWIAYLPVTARDTWLRWRRSEDVDSSGATALCWCWLVVPALFLSIGSSKLLTYIWPVFPAVAVLAAVGWSRLLEGVLDERAKRLLSRTCWLSCLTGTVVLPVVMAVVQSKYELRFGWAVWTAVILAGATAWVPLWFWAAGRVRATLLSAIFGVVAQFVIIISLLLPQVATATSGRQVAEHFNHLGRVPSHVQIAEARIGSLVFYLNRDLRAGLPDGWLEEVQLKRMHELPAPEPGTLLVLPEEELRRANRYLDLSGLPYESIGRFRFYRAAEVFQRSSQRSNHPRRKQAFATTMPSAAPIKTSLR